MKPLLEFVFKLEATLADPIQFGNTYEGARRMIKILEGTFEGPDIHGEVLNEAAADWQYTRHDDVTQAEATYALKTHDNVIIQIENFGLRHGPAEVLDRIAQGHEVDPAEYYFRTSPRFKAPAGHYEWLNRYIFVGTGARLQNGIKLWFYRVL